MTDVHDLEGVRNFRGLGRYPLVGGGHIRAKMIYRSGALELMTPGDCAWLSETAEIRTILDLRHPDELTTIEGSHALWDHTFDIPGNAEHGRLNRGVERAPRPWAEPGALPALPGRRWPTPGRGL